MKKLKISDLKNHPDYPFMIDGMYNPIKDGTVEFSVDGGTSGFQIGINAGAGASEGYQPPAEAQNIRTAYGASNGKKTYRHYFTLAVGYANEFGVVTANGWQWNFDEINLENGQTGAESYSAEIRCLRTGEYLRGGYRQFLKDREKEDIDFLLSWYQRNPGKVYPEALNPNLVNAVQAAGYECIDITQR